MFHKLNEEHHDIGVSKTQNYLESQPSLKRKISDTSHSDYRIRDHFRFLGDTGPTGLEPKDNMYDVGEKGSSSQNQTRASDASTETRSQEHTSVTWEELFGPETPNMSFVSTLLSDNSAPSQDLIPTFDDVHLHHRNPSSVPWSPAPNLLSHLQLSPALSVSFPDDHVPPYNVRSDTLSHPSKSIDEENSSSSSSPTATCKVAGCDAKFTGRFRRVNLGRHTRSVHGRNTRRETSNERLSEKPSGT